MLITCHLRTLSALLLLVAVTAVAVPAGASSWDKYKKIRQGDSSLSQEDAAQQGTAAEPVPTKPASQPMTKSKPKPKPAAVQVPAPPKKVKLAGKPPSIKSKNKQGKPNPSLITVPSRPTETGSWWAFYKGQMKIAKSSWYDPHGIDYEWAYSRKKALPADPRVTVFLHGSGGGTGAMWVFGPSPKGDIEVRTQDAETYNQDWREWWAYSSDGIGYPGRRIAAALDFVKQRYNLDLSRRGVVLEGPSMGGGGAVSQAFILPDPWRERIAYISGRAGVIMPRRVRHKAPGQYSSLPPDGPRYKDLWDSLDFVKQAASDPLVRGMHFRHVFSTNDQFSEGPAGNTQLEFVNHLERNKIAGAFMWVKAGHAAGERGVRMPDLANFEHVDQDVSLDRAHPAFTKSTGNYPTRMAARVDEEKFPRGHYNLGLLWHHAKIVDELNQLVFPIRYQHYTGMGKGIPDQPKRVTVSVTPRRPKQFKVVDGEILSWTWDGGALSGTVKVKGDTVTINKLPLVSGEDYKQLRLFRR